MGHVEWPGLWRLFSWEVNCFGEAGAFENRRIASYWWGTGMRCTEGISLSWNNGKANTQTRPLNQWRWLFDWSGWSPLVVMISSSWWIASRACSHATTNRLYLQKSVPKPDPWEGTQDVGAFGTYFTGSHTLRYSFRYAFCTLTWNIYYSLKIRGQTVPLYLVLIPTGTISRWNPQS